MIVVDDEPTVRMLVTDILETMGCIAIEAGDGAVGALEELLAAHAPTIPGVFLFFSERRQVLPKLRAFIEHVKANPVLT